ncbi:MAG: hypothetical protein JSR87_00485 [Proteobacteria bacterium]|nr:hypothetical protein [Pseudomonadota bacterium]MBS0572858.1 hypothetical protein [Pseudomonadota bacterium]
MRKTIRPGRGGTLHIMLGLAILGCVALTGLYGQSLDDLIAGQDLPERVATAGDKNAACAADTLETIFGTIGCGSSKKGAHLAGITFLSATKK